MKAIKLKAKKTSIKKAANSAVKKELNSKGIKAKKSSAKKKIISAVKKKATKPQLKKSIKLLNKKATAPLTVKSKAAIKKQPVSAKRKVEMAVTGISVPEILKQAEELHMIPVESIVHPITIEENKKLEPQFHQREDVLMHQENSKVKGAMANRKGTRNIFRSSRRA